MRGVLFLPALLFGGIILAEAQPNNQPKEHKSDAVPSHRNLLHIEEVIESTLAHHPLVQAAMEERIGAAGELLSTKGAFDRVVKGDYLTFAAGGYSGNYYNAQIEQPLEFLGSKVVGGFRQGTGTFPIYDDYYATNASGEARGGLEIPLWRDRDIDKRRASIGKATVQQVVADVSLQQRKIDLIKAASFAYWEWIAASQRVNVFEKLLAVAIDRDSQLRRRAIVGDLAQFDQIDNERQVLQRETQLLSARRAFKRSQFEQALFFRNQDGSPRDVSPFVPPPVGKILKPQDMSAVDERVEEAMKNRPEIKRLRQQQEQQKIELTLARNDLLPKLDLQSYLSRDLGQGKSDREETELRVGLKIEIPIQTRSQEGRVIQYEAKTRELSAQAEALQDRIAADVRDAINAIEISDERAAIAAKELDLARRLEKGERIKFVQGDSNLVFINLREQTTSDAEVRHIEALLEYHRSVSSYYAALGRQGLLR